MSGKFFSGHPQVHIFLHRCCPPLLFHKSLAEGSERHICSCDSGPGVFVGWCWAKRLHVSVVHPRVVVQRGAWLRGHRAVLAVLPLNVDGY